MSLFFELPSDIITYIYSFDRTFRNYMEENVLPWIHQYKVYTFKSSWNENRSWLIIDTENSMTLVTNSIISPTYRSFGYYFIMKNLSNYHDKKIQLFTKKQIMFILHHLEFFNENLLFLS